MASQSFYTKLLRNDLKKSLRAINEDIKDQNKIASKQASRGGMWGTIGGLFGQFGVPMLLKAAGLVTGPAGLVAASILSAGLLSYVGNKAGQGMGEKADPSGIEKQSLAQGTLGEAREGVSSVVSGIEESAKVDALKTGATAAASAVTMGADKYAAYATNPVGHFFKGYRSPEQHVIAGQEATKGLIQGTPEYTKALQEAGYGVMDRLPAIKEAPSDLFSAPSPTFGTAAPTVNLQSPNIPQSQIHSNLLAQVGVGGNSPLLGPGYTGAGVPDPNALMSNPDIYKRGGQIVPNPPFHPSGLFVDDDAYLKQFGQNLDREWKDSGGLLNRVSSSRPSFGYTGW